MDFGSSSNIHNPHDSHLELPTFDASLDSGEIPFFSNQLALSPDPYFQDFSNYLSPTCCPCPVHTTYVDPFYYSQPGTEVSSFVSFEENAPGIANYDVLNPQIESNRLLSTSTVTSATIDTIPRSLNNYSLAERMIKGMSMLMRSWGEGVLVEVWMPMKIGNRYVLSIHEQPFLSDNVLDEYREISTAFNFSTTSGPTLGLPGRVFTSKRPEWTSNVAHYNIREFLRVHHALDNKVRGTLAMPIFSPTSKECLGVLEVVTVKEKSNFDLEMENVRCILQDVELLTVRTAQVHRPQCDPNNQDLMTTEIINVLKYICCEHNLPLALAWIASDYSDTFIDEFSRVCLPESDLGSNDKNILCVHKAASYVHDKHMQEFAHACTEIYVQKGHGLVGKAIQSARPLFSRDIKKFDIQDYPQVHHARMFSLSAALAIRVKSTYTNTIDYVLEFFLPIDCKTSFDQDRLLLSISNTMQTICKSLRTIMEAKLVGDERVQRSETISCVDELDVNGNLVMQNLEPYNEARELDANQLKTTALPEALFQLGCRCHGLYYLGNQSGKERDHTRHFEELFPSNSKRSFRKPWCFFHYPKEKLQKKWDTEMAGEEVQESIQNVGKATP